MFAFIIIALISLYIVICIYTDPTGYSNRQVKEMNEMIKKGITPTDRTGPIIQYLVDNGIQDIRKQLATDVAKVQKMIESS